MHTQQKPFIVGLGETVWDELPSGRQAGGAPVNLAYHAMKAGAEAWAVSAVGEDADGDALTARIQEEGIRTVFARVPFPTGRVEVTLQHAVPSYRIVENAAWDHIPLTEEAKSLVRRADAVCFGTLAFRGETSRRTLRALLAESRPQALRFLDVNLRASYFSKELLLSLLQCCNALKINIEELAVLAGFFQWRGTEDTLCRRLLDEYRLQYLILTAGDKYSAVYTPGEISRLVTPAVSAVDTVGAGDAFSGAFLTRRLRGDGVPLAHAYAVQTAAFVCTRPGARPPYV